MHSRWAVRWLKGAMLLLALLGIVTLAGWTTLLLGRCEGGTGWTDFRCEKIPDTAGGLAFGAAFLGLWLMVRWTWALALVAVLPPLILEILARRRDRGR